MVAVQGTERDQAYPERTVYEITDTGRATARQWLTEMLAAPKQEFPQFPAALSHLLILPAKEVAHILERRLEAVTKQVHDLQTRLADQAEGGLDRVGLLEFEYLHSLARAEAAWLRAVIDDLDSGRLTW
jgi:DNA-binding PadR family transcriptional regulator